MNRDIYQTIKKRILFLEYKPGHILNEKTLAEEFGVSRTPLREVLSRLEWEQLVKILPRSGSIVSEIEFQKMMHVFQIRFEVEGLVGRLAAERITDDHLDNIAKIKEECNQLLHRENREDLWSVDLAFRNILYDAANNPVLRDMSQYLYNLTVRLWYITSARGDWAEEVGPLLNELELTLDALSKRDLEAAGRIRRHCLIDHFERIRIKFIGASSIVTEG